MVTAVSGTHRIPEPAAILYIAMTVMIMAYSQLFNVVPILIFLVLWLRHFYYKGAITVNLSAGAVWSLLLPLLCCYSVFWSDYPVKTLYTSLEFLSMILCTLIMSRTVLTAAWAKGLTLGIAAVLITTLINGTYSEDYLSKTRALVGLFGSKNEVGFFAEVGAFIALALLFSKIRLWHKVVFSAFPLAVCAYCLRLCDSATSVVSLVALLAMTLAVFLVTCLPRRFRMPALVLGVVTVAAAIVGITSMHLNIVDGLLQVLGKSPTLTGRTYLWSEGLKNGMETPVLGHGYAAFWVQGRAEAERYWREFYIDEQAGFHFHSLYVQTFVDLGALGFVLVAVLMLVCCYFSLRVILERGFALEPAMAFGLSFMFLLRSFVEVDLLGPFGAGPMLFFSIVPRLQDYARRKEPSGGSEAGSLGQQFYFPEEGSVLDQGA